MADKRKITVADETDLTVLRAKSFWDKNSKLISYVGSAIIIVIVGWYGYLNLVKNPNEKAAAKMIFPAENLFGKMASTGFNKDSVNIVLNGGILEGSNVPGLLKLINKYGGTESGNRAKYIAGACYLHIKEFDKAIKYLNEFDSHGANQIESRAYVMLGHAYAEKNKNTDALNYYKKAAEVNEKDEVMSAEALLTAAAFADATGNSNEAINLYQKLKEKYPSNSTVRSGEVDKYLAKLGILK